jgi:DNA-binding transcriptional LysR family regulator
MLTRHADIDLTSLRWSMAVARSGGFRSAAASLGVEQSAISRRVRRLEDDLGVSLFHRSTKGVSPTNAGRRFLRRVEILLDSLGLAVADARLAGSGQVGQLRIGLTFSFLSEALYHLIDRFHGAHPDVLIEMVEGRAEEHLQAVADQRLDIAVLPGGMMVAGLDISILWREPLLVALPRTHRLAGIDVLQPDDLSGDRVLVSAGDIGLAVFEALGSHSGGLDIVVQEAGAVLLLEQARMGLGVTLIGSGSLKGLRLEPDLVLRPLSLKAVAPLAVAAAWWAGNDNPVLRRFVSPKRVLLPSRPCANRAAIRSLE